MRWLKGNSAKNWRTYVWERGSAKNSDYVCPQRTFNLVSGICVRAHPTHRHHWLLKCTKLRPCLVSTVHRMFAKDVWFITGFVSLIPSAGYLRWSTGWPVKRPSPFNMCSILDRGCFFHNVSCHVSGFHPRTKGKWRRWCCNARGEKKLVLRCHIGDSYLCLVLVPHMATVNDRDW